MTDRDRKIIYSGTSGLVLPVPNKRSFPEAFQDKSRLTYYASLFNTVEINSSFKKLPMPVTVEKWAASVPDYFQFTFKLWSKITHNKQLDFNPNDVIRFMDVIDGVTSKKGCLLVQFPGKLTVGDSGQLAKLLAVIRHTDPEEKWKVALEFRNSSWYHQDIYDLLSHQRMAVVLHDMHSSPAPLNDPAAVGFVYVRLHGPERGYRGSYSHDFLSSYARRIKSWKENGKVVYVYFNNTLGDAVKNLMTLNRFMTDL